MTLLDLCDAPEGTDFTTLVCRYFLARPNAWISAYDLQRVGGEWAWRTRVSECRRRYGMTIQNQTFRKTDPAGNRFTISQYRYVP